MTATQILIQAEADTAAIVIAALRGLPGVPETANCPTFSGRTPIAMNHSTTIRQLGEDAVQAACSCGWRSPVSGAGKATGTMDPQQHATEAADLHEREMSLRLAPQA